MYDARVVANELLKMAWAADKDMTQLDIQKICYFMNGHHLMDHGEPMIRTEFEAWKHGPVQKVLYDSFKKYGDGPITDLATAFDPIRRSKKSLPEITSNSVRTTLSKYFEFYIDVPYYELVGITHRRGTPWHVTRENSSSSVNIGMRISTETIRSCFEGVTA